MPIRIPTEQDFRNHTGLHYHQLWRATPDWWACPACARTKFQIMRWTRRFPGSPGAFYDWVAQLHGHHDHSLNCTERGTPRFARTIICGQCNGAEGAAKRLLLKEGVIPTSKFSFTPEEIGKFVTAVPHGPHGVQIPVAREVYLSLRLR